MSETAVGIVGLVVVALYAIHKGARVRFWNNDQGMEIDPRDEVREE